MSQQTWMETLIAQTVDGAALANTVTATSIIHASARYTLPSNYFSEGKTLRITAQGRISTVVTSPGTLTLDVRLGTIASPIVVFNGAAMNLNVNAQTNATWLFEALLTCRAIGAGTAANLMGIGHFTSRAIIGAVAVAAGGVTVTPLPDTAPAVGTGFDSTITNVIDLFGKWSTANAANSIQVHNYTVESMN